MKDIFAYLRVIVNPSDQEALLRIINQPRRGIGDISLDQITAYNRSKDLPLWEGLKNLPSELSLSAKSMQGIQQFVTLIEEAQERFSKKSLLETTNWLVETINYKQAIQEEVKSTQMREFKWENVQEFISSIADYEKQVETPSLHDFITSTPLQSDWEQKSSNNNGSENKVSLLTFHSSKGLEFPYCFLVGIEDHIIPHEKSLKETGIEEERRLMYVAITRAMSHLTISMARQRKRLGQEAASRPSRFLFDIPKELIKMTNWGDLPKSS